MAVYTKLSHGEIVVHLKQYDIGELLDFKEVLAGIDNSNFILETTAGKFVLTIFESRINKEELPFFINLKAHLAKKGVYCPKPLLSLKSEVLLELKGKKSIIVSFLQGKNLEPQQDGYYSNIKVEHCFEVGKELAKMHLAVADFKMSRFNELGVYGFEALFNKFSQLIDKNLQAEILRDLKFLQENWQGDLPRGAAHLDIFPDNIFFDDKQKLTGVIDFYFAATDLWIYDFAIAVNAWCFDEKNNFISEKFEKLLQGYESLRKFLPAEKDFLKIALFAAAMRFLLTRIHDKIFTPKDSLVKIKDPEEYLAKFRYFRGSYERN